MMVAVAMTAAIPIDNAFAKPTAEEKKTKKAKMAAQFADMTVAEVQAAIKEGKVTVIDVNKEASYNAGHVPGALHFTAVKKDLAKALPEDKGALIVAYCSGPK